MHPSHQSRTASGPNGSYDVHARSAARAAERGDFARLDDVIAQWAHEARRCSKPPEVFIVHVKACMYVAGLKLAPPDRQGLVAGSVRRAIEAYYAAATR